MSTATARETAATVTPPDRGDRTRAIGGRVKAVVPAVVVGVAILVLWEVFVVVRDIKPFLLPKPSAIWSEINENLSGIWSETWGRDAVAQLFDGKGKRPDALFCGNDQIARGAADALRERGLSVPADVAIVGFDNWEVMTLAARPPLTSIDMNLTALGREAGESLIEMIGGKRLTGVRRRPCSLVVRQSTVG